MPNNSEIVRQIILKTTPLDALPELAPTLELLFSESSSNLPGRQTALDHLFV
jgi:hypothetical protein